MTTLGPPLVQVGRSFVKHGGRKFAYFGGCDYFRLARDPTVIEALVAGARRFGADVAASRLTTANHPVYGTLERELAAWFGAPAAVLLPCGSLTNLAVAEALAGEFSHVLVDARAHGCLREAAGRFGGRVLEFAHREARSAAAAVRRCGRRARIILLTDGVFGRDGSVAPLAGYRAVLPADAWMLVDDAHGAGVVGEHGRGTLEHAGVGRRRVVQTLTLSKAFGVFGGVVLGSLPVARKVMAGSWFGGSTPLPPALAEAARRALQLLRNEGTRRRRLASKVEWVRRALGRTVDPVMFPGPLVEVVPRDRREAGALRLALMRRRVYPSFVRYPGGPEAGYFRFAISSEHTRPQLAALVAAIRSVRPS